MDSSGANSAANVSARVRSNYLTAARLAAIQRELDERDWRIVNFLAAHRLATGYQLTRIFWATVDQGSSEARAARRTLKRLADRRILERLRRQVGGARGDSAGMVYRLGGAGLKLLARRGFETKRLGAPGSAYVDHTLALTEVVVRLHEADRAGELDLIEVQAEPSCWRGFLGAMGARLVLKPDLFVRVGVGAFEDRWMVEVDLATEASGTLLAKAKRYLAHYRSGLEQAEHGVYPRVLWGVPDDQRQVQLTGVLDRLPDEARRIFTVCLLGEIAHVLAAEAAS